MVHNTNVDSQRRRQNVPSVDTVVAPVVVECEYHVRAADGDVALHVRI